ncbi:MAG: hypothetical protein MR270_02305 [Erysipelotrichaceae bacterium]|nr:hypothetical protein [Erysipelotrichaceae bacterium]
MKNKYVAAKIIFFCVITVLFLPILLLCLFLKYKGSVQGNIEDIFFYFFIFAFVVFYAFTLFRIDSIQQRRIFNFIFCLNIFFILDDGIQSLTSSITLARYCEYLHYLPLIYVSCMFNIFFVITFFNNSIKRNIYIISIFIISFVLFCLVMTNDFHQLFLKYDDNKAIYGLGLVYYIVYFYIVILYLFNSITFFIKTKKLSNFFRLVVSFVPFLLFSLYLYLCINQNELLNKIVLLNKMSLAHNVLFILIFEVFVYGGLLQNNGKYSTLFEACALPLKIVDNNGKVMYQSALFSDYDYYSEQNNDKVFITNDIVGGKVIIEENIRKINSLNNKLNKNIEQLKNANSILIKSRDIIEEGTRLNVQKALYDTMEEALSKKSKEIELLLSLIPNSSNEANKDEIIYLLRQIKLRIGYLKQKCILLLQGKESKIVKFNQFYMIIGVMCSDIKTIGFDSFAYVITGKDDVFIEFVLAINEIMEYIGENFSNHNCVVFVSINSILKRCKINIDGVNKSYNISNIRQLPTYGYLLKVSHDGKSITIILKEKNHD